MMAPRAAAFALSLSALAAGGEPMELGGHISGAGSNLTAVLHSLEGLPGIRWTRGGSPAGLNHGFRWINDIRYYQPGHQRPPERLAEDLFSIYWACRTNLPVEPRPPDAWEVYNEPDFFFVENNAADMAAVLKAAWCGIKAERPEVPVLMPSMAFRPSRYLMELAHNGLASWTDGLNVHFYGWAADYTDFLAQYRVFTAAARIPGPWWVTEIGYFQLPVTVATDVNHLARQAAFHERTVLESWAEGVDRHLAFILTHRLSAGSDMVLTDPNGHWRPALHSLVRLAALLPGAEPKWSLVHRPSQSRIGLVLELPDGTWWSVLWSPGRARELAAPEEDSSDTTPERLRVALAWPRGVEEVRVGLEGNVLLHPDQLSSLDLNPETTVHLRTPAIRFGISDCRWVPFQRGSGSAPRIPSAIRRELRELPPRRDPSPVVARLQAGEEWRIDKPRQSWRLAPSGSGIAILQLHNFTTEPAQGRWQLEVPAGWRVKAPGDVPASPSWNRDVTLSGSVRVEALARVEIPVEFTPTAAVAPMPERVRGQWMGEEGSVDSFSVRIEPDLPLPPTWRRYTSRDFQPRQGHLDAVQIFGLDDDSVMLEVRRPGGMHGDALVFLPLPAALRASDLFTARIHADSDGAPIYAQAFLLTSDAEVWRHGEWELIPSEGLPIRAGLGDFSPTIWSRHRHFVEVPLSKARWLALRFQGLEPGQLIEIEEPALRRR